jgi:hypothetical protein
MDVAPYVGFGDIEFGFASGEVEGAESPDLLLEGFFDASHLTERALSKSTFAFLGYKGSGKSALAQRARLMSLANPRLFVSVTTLDRFSYRDFKSVAGGDGDSQTRYPTAWGWLLLVQLIQSLEQDEGGRLASPPEYSRAIKGLRDLGFMPVPQLGQLVKQSSKKSFKASLPKLLEYVSETSAAAHDLQMNQAVNALEAAVRCFETQSRHVIFLDGLDSIVTQRELQLQSLAALMDECARLNLEFRQAGRPFKFVVLCRADIFDRLPGANINKIRQDGAVTLDWYDTPGEPDRSKLLRMLNRRARLSLRRRVNVFSEFFPPKIDGRDARTVILDHTRHTPRDLVQVMRKIQEAADEGQRRLTVSQVKDGLRAYSATYFIPELRNELAGYLEHAEIENAVMLLTAVRKQQLTMQDLEHKAKELGLGQVDLRALIRVLFDASCLGTVEETGGRRRYTFKYRSPNATVVPGEVLWLHPGALKGLNIHVGGRRTEHRNGARGGQRKHR